MTELSASFGMGLNAYFHFTLLAFLNEQMSMHDNDRSMCLIFIEAHSHILTSIVHCSSLSSGCLETKCSIDHHSNMAHHHSDDNWYNSRHLCSQETFLQCQVSYTRDVHIYIASGWSMYLVYIHFPQKQNFKMEH